MTGKSDLDRAIAIFGPFVEQARRSTWLINKSVGDFEPKQITITAGQAREAVRFMNALKEESKE